jgi:cobalt/nickel transport system permease protein
MHIPDGFVSGRINLAAYAVSVGVCAVAIARANRTLGERQVPLLGITAAFIFAAQMLNFPVAGGTSGHFLGALFGAVLLGPLNACLAMAVVLAIQCLVFADGGLTALGVNILNMGVIGGIGSYIVFYALRLLLPRSRRGLLTAAAAAAWCSVVLAAGACALELALSGASPMRIVVPAMLGVHALIGVGEAVITSVVLSTILAVRPDLVVSIGNGQSPTAD